MKYYELKCRTHYSFLRGASHPHELIERALELGLSGLAITDRDGVYGMPRAWAAAREHRDRFAFITGAELTLEGVPCGAMERRDFVQREIMKGEGAHSAENFANSEIPRVPAGVEAHAPAHLTLLAMNRAGYGLMCRMLTASHENHEKGTAGLAWVKFLEMLDRPGGEALIALLDAREAAVPTIAEALKPRMNSAVEPRLYLALTRHLDGCEDLAPLAQALGLPPVAVNDVHYHVADRSRLQDVLVATRENTPLSKIGYRVFSNAERRIKSPGEMIELFNDLAEAIENTEHIAKRCAFRPDELRYYYPSEWIPSGETAQSWLTKLVDEGAKRRYPDGTPLDVQKQINHELSLIAQLNYADYFLTIWEIVDFARSKDILCQGRGSAANSVVCYCLGITAIDPVRMQLLFERFISVERGEPPDIDVDFENARREEVIQHIYDKYGRDRAGMVAALITYREKSAVRDVNKALQGVPNAAKHASALIEEIQGFPRHLSIHSGGFTLSKDPLIEIVPIEPARMEGRTIVQWDKEDLAILGLLKVDVLALGMLTALKKSFELLEARGTKLTVATIPPDDPATYDMICRGDTVGVFQIESRAQMSMTKRLKPRTFYDLVVEIAIVRPGPIVGKMVHPYLRRRRGEEPVTFPDPRLKPILARTLGVPIFQEQVMKIAVQLAGFTPGEADELRRAIGAWRSAGTIEKMGRKLYDGLLAEGIPKEFVERIFEQVKGFSEYGFPESHAASFALLAYASCYLRCHHPAEFTASLINSQPMGFYSTSTLVWDAKRNGVTVLPIDPNASSWECTVPSPRVVRMGWCVVSGLGEEQGRRIEAERRARPFVGLVDFMARTRLSYRVLASLCMGGAFDGFGFERREALWGALAFDSLFWERKPKHGFGEQLGLFTGARLEALPRTTGFLRALGPYQRIEEELAAYGYSLDTHPMQQLRAFDGVAKLTTSQAREAPQGRQITIAGLVIARQRPPTAKGTAFATLEDEHGFVDLILHKPVFERYHAQFTETPFIQVTGRLQRDGLAVSLIVSRVDGLNVADAEVTEVAEFAPSKDFRVVSRDFR